MKYWWGRINVEKITLTISFLLYFIKETIEEKQCCGSDCKIQHTQVRKIYICPHALHSTNRCICHYNTYSFSKSNIHRNGLIWCPEIMLSFIFIPRYAHSIIRLSPQCSSLPMLQGSLAVGWEHYPLRPCCCLIINLAQTDPSLAIFSMLGVCWEAFFSPCFVAVLDFWHDVSQNFSS